MYRSFSSLTPRTGAAYIRVSTNDQMELSPESQQREILKFAEANDIVIPSEYFFIEKEGRSGKRAENRPEFQRMIATAKTLPRPFDVILVWKFSRFARNQDESTFYKGMLRKKLGINILSVSEPVLDGMYGRLIEMIIEWQDEFYSYNLSAEVRRGMEQRAQRGGYQSALPLGYRHMGTGMPPTVIEEQAKIVRLIFSLCAEQGQTPSAIARELNERGYRTARGNLFEKRTVSYILKNPFYMGTIRWNRAPHGSKKENPQNEIIMTEGCHEAIISKELFDKAAQQLTQAERGGLSSPRLLESAGTAGTHFLSGLLRCPVCGAGLSFSRAQTPNFQCWKYAKGIHKISASISEKKVLNALKNSLAENGFQTLIPLLENPAVSVREKKEALQRVLCKIIYEKKTGTFYFYYNT